jgi:hypothetical protein
MGPGLQGTLPLSPALILAWIPALIGMAWALLCLVEAAGAEVSTSVMPEHVKHISMRTAGLWASLHIRAGAV